jgi:preprotein translocase subunit SecG
MQLFLTVLHLMLALGLIGLILIQHGKGADAGAAFGSGASATVFGAQGSGSFLTRLTAILATVFFLTSIALAYYAAQVGEPAGLMDGVEAPVLPFGTDNDLPAPTGALPGEEVAADVIAVEEAQISSPDTDLPPVDVMEVPALDAVGDGSDLPPMPVESAVEEVAPDANVSAEDAEQQ